MRASLMTIEAGPNELIVLGKLSEIALQFSRFSKFVADF